MNTIILLLIPLAIVCIGVIICSIYSQCKWKYYQWKAEFQEEILKNTKQQMEWSIQNKIDEKLEKMEKEIIAEKVATYPMVERFQKLAGINSSRKDLRDRFNRVRSTCTNSYTMPSKDYNFRFNLKDMCEDVWVPVKEK